MCCYRLQVVDNILSHLKLLRNIDVIFVFVKYHFCPLSLLGVHWYSSLYSFMHMQL